MAEQEASNFDKLKHKYGSNIYKTVFIAISVLLFFIMPVLSFDVGLTDDERVHNEHGVRIMNYYLGHDTAAAAIPIDANGEWRFKKEPDNYPVTMNIYGGFFDMISAFVYKYITSGLMGEYESKHLMISLAGVALFILTGLIAFELTGSWAGALIALLFAALSPRLVGHSFDNPKDLPFATTFAFGLYQIILTLNERLQLKWKRIILLIIAFIMAIDTRVGGIMLLCYLMLFSTLFIAYDVLALKTHIKKYITPYLILIGVCMAGYLGASLFWPWAGRNPIMNPLISLRIFSQFSQFNSYELFEGVRINNDSIPWYFVIKWFYITFPVFLFSGFLPFIILAWFNLRVRSERFFSILLIVVALILPLALVIVQKSNLYDDARHLYFVIPSFLALAAVGWYWLFKRVPRMYMWPVIALCVMTMIEPLLFMVRNHPHEVMYFSPLAGGVRGAFKTYEMDYWGFSLKAGLNWLDNTDSVLAKNRKTRVRMWYGEQLKIRYYTDKSKHLEYILANDDSPDWDYRLLLPAESKYNPDLLANWPPPNTIHQITVDDIPLCAIVRNPLSELNPNHGDIAAALPAQDMMGRGLAYYNAKNYNKAVIEFKALLKVDSNNRLAYNNLVASYNLLQMYKDALEIGAKGIVLFPDFELLRNNLVYSHKGLKELKPDENYLKGLSYNYYIQGEYQKCITASEEILRLNPKSIAAYNNICTAQNALGNFKAGETACQKGLALAPTEQLLKNNLAVSEKGLKGQ